MRLVSGDPKTIVSTIPGGYAVRYVPDEKIQAKIDGSFTLGAITFYTWSEVRALLNGSGYEVVTGGRTGTSTAAYATEINGSSSVATNTIVTLYKRIIADTTPLGAGGGVVALYEFTAGGGGGGGAVSSVQCVGNILYVTYG
jgi:hypothetical protein